jgi:ubiquinone biosynthesis protein UbiJ
MDMEKEINQLKLEVAALKKRVEGLEKLSNHIGMI